MAKIARGEATSESGQSRHFGRLPAPSDSEAGRLEGWRLARPSPAADRWRRPAASHLFSSYSGSGSRRRDTYLHETTRLSVDEISPKDRICPPSILSPADLGDTRHSPGHFRPAA